MLMSILIGLFTISNVFLIALITMQKNHGGFWSGPSGNDSSMLFGGNQGIDILQKLTWIFGFILLFGCLSLSLFESSSSRISKFYQKDSVEKISTKTENEKFEENPKKELENKENK